MQLIVARPRLFAALVTVSVTLATVATARAQPPETAKPQEPGPEPPAPPPPAAEPGAPAPEGSAETTPAAEANDIDVHLSSEVAGYADTDHVFVVSPTIAGNVARPTAGWSFGGRYLVDVVSAASVDIVSTASRRWEELRHVGAVDGAYKPGNTGVSASANVSSEPDYLSLTAGGSVTQDVLAKNLTLLLGYEHGHDLSGRTGTPFSIFSRTIDHEGLKAGGTVLLDHATVLSVVGDLILERGDSSKPYRYIPLFAPGTSVPKGAPVELVNQLRVTARPLEQLPTSRDRWAISARMAHRFTDATLRADERGYVDSWGLAATTTDLRYLFDLGARFEVGPHVRFHAQSAVDFWQRAYVLKPGFDVPALRTGDRELGPLYNFTGGSSFKWRVGPATNPRAWTLGLDLNVTTTQYLDALYTNSRLSGLGAFSLEADL